MSLARKCDICGEEYKHYSESRATPNAVSFVYHNRTGTVMSRVSEYKCCKSCINSITNFIEDIRFSLKPVPIGELIEQGWDIDKIGFENLGDSR